MMLIQTEFHLVYEFLSRLHKECKPRHAQLFARMPRVSLLGALSEVCAEDTRLHGVGLLEVSSMLATRSPAPSAPVPDASRLVLRLLHCLPPTLVFALVLLELTTKRLVNMSLPATIRSGAFHEALLKGLVILFQPLQPWPSLSKILCNLRFFQSCY